MTTPITRESVGVLYEKLHRKSVVKGSVAARGIGAASAACCGRRACRALMQGKFDSAISEAKEAARRNSLWVEFSTLVEKYITQQLASTDNAKQ